MADLAAETVAERLRDRAARSATLTALATPQVLVAAGLLVVSVASR